MADQPLYDETPPTDVIAIDAKYTYVFDAGNVFLLRHGENWIKNPEASKAWIAAGCEIEQLRKDKVALEKELAKIKAILNRRY